MDTIRNYMETMFANLPDTPEMRKAKQELMAMMEDKYNELIESGMPKNEVIGTIISEFGNIEELAESMGIDLNNGKHVEVVTAEIIDSSRRYIGINEASEYAMDYAFGRFLLGLGVFFCILSPAGPILGEGFCNLFGNNVFGNFFESLGIAFLFISTALGVGLIILSSAKKKEWKFLKKEHCALDSETEQYIMDEKRQCGASSSIMLAVGIIFCIVSVVPVSVFGALSISDFLSEGVGPSMIFVLIGIGVFFILNASRKESAYSKLLSLNKG